MYTCVYIYIVYIYICICYPCCGMHDCRIVNTIYSDRLKQKNWYIQHRKNSFTHFTINGRQMDTQFFECMSSVDGTPLFASDCQCQRSDQVRSRMERVIPAPPANRPMVPLPVTDLTQTPGTDILVTENMRNPDT